jgi:hypothetical protein
MQRRALERGAVFVESVIVIAALTLGLTGLVFFRDCYQKRLQVMRLARASAVAHSMAGCKANQPRDWVGPDLARYQVKDTQKQTSPARGGGSSPVAGGDDGGRAKRLLDKTGTTSSDGEGLLNPITSSDFSGQSEVSGRSELGRERTLFTARPRSQSFVTCGDEVKDGDYDKVLEMIKDEAQALFNTR